MGDTLGAFLWAEAQEESGGRYLPWPGGNKAIGKYQVMPGNVAAWTKRALGHSLTPQQFANDPAAQEAVARTILGGYYAKYGPAGAAAAWFSGSPNPNSNASDGNTTVRQYVANVLSLMQRAPASASAGPLGSTSDGVDHSGGTGGGTATTGGGTTATQASTKDTHPDCLWGINLPVVGYTCILTKGQGRAITGALLLASATVVGGAGVIILAAYGLKKSGALDTAAAAANVVPGAGKVAGGLASASGRLSSSPGARSAARQQRAEHAERQGHARAREQRAQAAAVRAQAREERASRRDRERREKGGDA